MPLRVILISAFQLIIEVFARRRGVEQAVVVTLRYAVQRVAASAAKREPHGKSNQKSPRDET